MGAAIVKRPELALDEAEAKSLADAIRGVSEHYDLVVDPKTAAWGNLGLAVAAVYGPRLFAMAATRRAAKPAPAPAPQPAEPSPVPAGDLFPAFLAVPPASGSLQ